MFSGSLLVIGIAAQASAIAESLSPKELSQDWYTQFYFSQSVVHTSDNNFLGNSDDDISFDFYEASAFLSKPLSPELMFSTQIAIRSAGEIDDGSPRVDFAYFSYSFAHDFDKELGVRLGRVKVPWGLYNEVRDVSFSRPGAILPQSTYSESTRNAIFSRDGMIAYANFNLGENVLRTHASITRPSIDNESFFNIGGIFFGDNDSEISGKLSYGLGAFYDFNQAQSTIGISLERLRFDDKSFFDIPLIANDEIIFASGFSDQSDTILDSLLLSYQMRGEKWTFSSEVSMFRFDFEEFIDSGNAIASSIEAAGFDVLDDFFQEPTDQDGYSYYFQGEYHINPQWTLLARYDHLVTDRDFANDPSAFAKDATIGITFQPNQHLSFSLEYHNIEGFAWLDGRENNFEDLEHKFFDLVIFQAAFRY